MSDDNEFLAELQGGFLQEASDLLASAEECFLRLEQDPKSQPDLDQLFRAFHNIKGSSAAVEFLALSKFTHQIENLLVPIKNGKISLTGEHIELLLLCNDRVKHMIEALKKDRKAVIDCADLTRALEVMIGAAGEHVQVSPSSKTPALEAAVPAPVIEMDPRLLQDFFADAADQLEAMDQNLLILEKDWNHKEAINALFRAFHTMKSASAILGFGALERLAHEVESVLDPVRNGEVAVSQKVLNPCFEAVTAVRNMVEEIRSTGALKITLEDPVLRLLIGKLRPASESELPADEARKPSAGQSDAIAAASVMKEPVKVDADRLDRLVDTIGELVIAEAMISQSPELKTFRSNDNISRQVSQLNKITRILQEIGMSLRMVPVRPTFRKMSRIVRDVSKKLGKEVNLETMGEETELDKTVADKIGDPLVHMVRNAVDHGIEKSVEERTRIGKPAAGKVALRAFHKSGNIWIEIEDDGRGLDKNVLLTKARDKGLVPEGKYLTDAEIYNLIFLPGFSTAEKVTDVSGRGVGMDVVRKNIEAIRGQVEIRSEVGKGTKFIIRIPNTLAIVEGMVILIGKERYVVPTYGIVRSLKLGREDILTVSGEKGEVIKSAGKIYPLIRLSEFFGVPGAETDPTKAIVLMVDDEGQQAALLIDKILKQQQFVIKNLGEFMKDTPGISGGTIMPDGDVGLILDVGAIIKAKDLRLRGRAPEAARTQGLIQEN